MPYLSTGQEWYTQSSLLLQARPTTTRITTTYSTAHPKPNSKKRLKKPAPASSSTTPAPTSSDPAPSPATLTLKTYCPESGICLKYQTNKAQEVGRLIASLGRLSKPMAGLDDKGEDVAMGGTEGEEKPAAAAAAGEEGKAQGGGAAPGAKDGGASGGQGGRKKKKGKK